MFTILTTNFMIYCLENQLSKVSKVTIFAKNFEQVVLGANIVRSFWFPRKVFLIHNR